MTRAHAMVIGILMAAAGPALRGETAAARGFEHFYNLEYDAAIANFRLEIAQSPSAPEPYNHLAQAILYRGLYQSGLLENSLVSGEDLLLSVIKQPKLSLAPADDREFTSAIQKARDLAEQKLKSNPDDTAGLFALGVSHGLRANYKFLVEKAWLSAIRDSNAARKLHNRVAELAPGEADARMMQGIHDYVVASLPAGFRLLTAVVGIRGDKERGLRTLDEIAANGKEYRTDAAILLSTLYRHEKSAGKAVPHLRRLEGKYPRNYLLRFAEVYTHIDAGDVTGASRALGELRALAQWGAPGYGGIHASKLRYADGLVEMRAGRLDRALQTFESLVYGPQPVDAMIRLRATVRLGQTYDLRGERPQALRAYQTVVAAAPQTRCARESQHYLVKPYHAGESD